MSGIGPCLIFLFLAPIIFVALIAFDSANPLRKGSLSKIILLFVIILEQLSFLALVLLPKQMLMLCLL